MSDATTGSASAEYATPAASVAQMFVDRVAATPRAEALRYPVPGGWESLTWEQTHSQSVELAAGLLSLGVVPEDRVAILASTRYEWILADLAVMCAGAATTTVYPSTETGDVAYILADSGTKVVIAENDLQLDKLREQRAAIPTVEKVIVIDGEGDGDWVISWSELAKLGAAHLADDASAVDKVIASIEPENLATLIYTSGTTGKPKGVELTHACWTYEGAAIEAIDVLRPDDVQFLWLPLSHSFGKVLMAAQLQIGFSTAVDGRIEKIVENLAEIHPTFMAGAPRIFEKVHARVVQTALGEGGPKAKIFQWAFGVGREVSRRRQQGLEPVGFLKVQHAVADKLVFSKIQDRLGGNLRYLVSGSAALSREVAEWFHAAGLLILEGYGLTETSAATCLNRPETFRFGSVGEPFPGTEIRIAADGEILIRGPGVMRGYHGMPEQTAEVLDADGWFATGDVGEIDEGGRIRITDRKKDLVKTSGGKYIAPSAIEARFKSMCPIAGQMVVHADRRNYATALITLDPDTFAQWAEQQGMSGDYATMVNDDRTRATVQASVDELNATLNRWETVKEFRILDHDFSVETGELTPSLKVKRKVVESMYEEVLDSMYGGQSRG
ncbi:MAG: long-chain fatty acid--CoA ligase [Actinomycetota bacterium]|nr:long-chain fatty acid--CoA ligase [Actinomycetota bacterium]MDH4353470.1 long-chain fatty acid--CoA ligase [Actinomycetota bacterium]